MKDNAGSMIELRRAILHILDLNSGVPVYSDQDLDREIFPFLQKHLEKAWKDAGAHQSHIGEVNPIRKALANQQEGSDAFRQVSRDLAAKLYQDLLLCGEEKAVDLVACEFYGDGFLQFGLLVYQNQLGYTHKVAQDGEDIRNEIIHHYAILPNPNQKVSMFAFIDQENWTVRFADKKRELDGEEVYLLPDRLINCTMPISQKDTVKKVQSIVNKVAEEFGQNAAQAVSKAKVCMLHLSEDTDSIVPEEIGRQVFGVHPGMETSFREQLALSNLPKEAPLDRDYAMKVSQSHKIRLDTGIELNIPTELLNNPDYVEFINNDNGTISIALKNIGKITNR